MLKKKFFWVVPFVTCFTCLQVSCEFQGVDSGVINLFVKASGPEDNDSFFWEMEIINDSEFTIDHFDVIVDFYFEDGSLESLPLGLPVNFLEPGQVYVWEETVEATELERVNTFEDLDAVRVRKLTAEESGVEVVVETFTEAQGRIWR